MHACHACLPLPSFHRALYLQGLQGVLHGFRTLRHESSSCLELLDSFLEAPAVQPSKMLHQLGHQLLAWLGHELGGACFHQQLEYAVLRACAACLMILSCSVATWEAYQACGFTCLQPPV